MQVPLGRGALLSKVLGSSPLADVAIRNEQLRAKPYKMGDASGLFLLVQPSGGKLRSLADGGDTFSAIAAEFCNKRKRDGGKA